jgi:hypothetical protein
MNKLITWFKRKKTNRMFVLVRDDLYSQSYKAVQGGHALAEYLLKHGGTK